MVALALADLRVLDLTQGIAGPFCTKLLADFGADVLKVEPPGGDPARRLGPFPRDIPDPERSGLFLHLNANKRGRVLDLKTPAGRQAALDLAARADLVVESYRPGTLERLGLGWSVLTAINPRLVLVSLSDFGQTGPYRDWRGSEIVHYGFGGAMLSTGLPHREPIKLGGTVTLYQAGNVAALVALGALYGARTQGYGQHVDVAIAETAFGSMDRRISYLLGYAYTGRPVKREQVAGFGFPFGPYPCLDGYFGLYGGMDYFANTCRMIGRPELASDERYGTPVAQQDQARRAEFDETIFLPWILERTKQEALAAGQAAGVPCAAINTMADVRQSAQLAARGYWVERDHAVAGRLTYPGQPFRLSDVPQGPERAAPILAETASATWQARPAAEPPIPARAPTGRGDGPLAGVRVLDLSIVWAGPYSTMLLGDLGAEVIRVESARRWAPLTRGFMPRPTKAMVARMGPIGGSYPDLDPGERPWNRAAMFNCHARNKLGLTVDIAQPAGAAIVRRLVGLSDVLVSNNGVGVLERFGLGWDDLRRLRPDLVYLAATGMGQTGPDRQFRAYGIHFEDMIGHTWLRGYADSDPTQTTNDALSDATSGVGMAFAALVGLHWRNRTGQGSFIDLAQTEYLLPFLGQAFMDHELNGRIPGSLGNRDPDCAPQGVYRCAGEDRWLALTVDSDAAWARLVARLGAPQWARDPALATVAGRRAAHDRIDQGIAAWTASREARAAAEQLQAAGLAAAPLLDEAAAYADPQLAARGWFQTVTQAECGTHRYPGFLWQMSATPPAVRLPPVRLGEHNEPLYRELLGLDAAAYADLVAAGHISRDLDLAHS